MDPLPLSASARTLGQSALRVYPLAYGCWRFADSDRANLAAAREKIETALEVGINLFDHADIYGGNGAAEELFGRVLSEAPRLREGMVLATKCGIVPGIPYDSSRGHIVRAAEASLRRLRTDVIDLYQIHRPDPLAHPAEVAAAFVQLRQEGKIREVGVSNYTAAQFEALQAHLPFPIATHQPELSAWQLEPLRDGVLDQCLHRRVTPLAWSPMARGLLGLPLDEARRHPNGDRLTPLLECLDRIAAREGVPRSAAALAFLLVHPAGVVPILGTQRPQRIRESAQAFGVRLDRRDWYEILQASRGKLP
jgi:predicted oxidoreductase